MDGSISTTRLYASAIALVSGGYSVFVGAGGLTANAWFMLLVGAVVAIHGVALLSPAAERLGGASGPLMIGYAVLMLANQGWSATMGGGMGGPMGGGGMGGTAGTMGTMGWDPGMVALAALMLASGAIMTIRSDMT